MTALTSLLVRDRVIPVSKIEDALQQQVLSAADIDTVLLEMNLVPEDVLAGYRAAAYGLLPATRDEVMRAPREAIEHCPPSLAIDLRVVPMLLEGRALVMASADPPTAEILQQLARATSCDVSIRIVTMPRVRAALFHHYGAQLDPRTARLIETLRRREPGIIPYVRPPSPTQRPAAAGIAGAASELLRDLGLSEGVSLRPPRPPTAELDALPAPAQHTTQIGLAPVQPGPQRRPLSTMPPPAISAAVARAARGPLSESRVAALLDEATHRDEVLYVVLRYAAQFFDFVTLFTVTKDGARGRLSHGAGLTPDVLEQVVVPLTGNGVFARAARDKRPDVGDIGSSPEERMAAALLGRPTQRPGLAVPFLLQGRAVLMLFAERDGEGLSDADAEPLLAITTPVGAALRRLILETKTLTRSSPPGPNTELAREPEPAPTRPAPDADLAAVDLESVSRISAPAWTDARFQVGGGPPRDPSTRHVDEDADTVPGIPKTPPPPPARPSLGPPGGASAGTYSLGHVNAPQPESIRPTREPSARAPQGARELAPELLPEIVEPALPPMPAPAPTPAAPQKRLVLVPNDNQPSVIIDMGEPVRVLVDQLAHAGPNDPMPELRELLRLGEGVLPVLIQRFPGPLWFDVTNIQVRAPFGRDVSAIALALVSFGERSAPYLSTLLGTAVGEVAICGLLVAGELVHPELLDAVSRRVLDPDGDVRYVALLALRAYARLPQFPSVLRALSDISERPGKDPRRQRLAVEALGELRDHRALRTLVARLGDAQENIVQAAHRALVELTLQDFGPSQRKWESWAEEHGGGHRIEWLIHALMHTDPGLRAVAADELKRTTQQYFGYHPALPKRERELAQRKYRDWWDHEGQRVFAAQRN